MPPDFIANSPSGAPVNPDRWKQIDNLLQSVLELPPGERRQFLRQACADDEALEREVQSLLEAQQKAGGFLESPAIAVAAKALTELGNENPQGSFSEPAEATARPRSSSAVALPVRAPQGTLT
jgi:hypothetical protein